MGVHHIILTYVIFIGFPILVFCMAQYHGRQNPEIKTEIILYGIAFYAMMGLILVT